MYSEVTRAPEKLITNTQHEHNLLNLLTVADGEILRPNRVSRTAEDLLPALILGTTDAVLQSTCPESGVRQYQYFNPLENLPHNFRRQRHESFAPTNPYQFLRPGVRPQSLANRYDFLRTPQALPLPTELDGFFNPNYLADFTPAAPQFLENFQPAPVFDYLGKAGNADGQDFFEQLSSTIGGIFDWAIHNPQTIMALIKTVGTIAATLAL